MHQNHIALILILLSWILPAVGLGTDTDIHLNTLSVQHLEERLTAIDSDLQQLAHFSLRGGIGAIGCRSAGHLDPERTEWFEIDLEETFTIDEIVLVPTLWRDTERGFKADGFPLAFRIFAGTDDNRTGSVIVEHQRHKSVLPRIAPLVIPIAKTRASWIRIEAMNLSPRAFDGLHAFQLAELLVFDGPENVALRCAVKTSSRSRDTVGAWHPNFLVDGFTPYLMDSAQGSQSLAYISVFREKPTLILDLGQPYPLSRIHLHAVDQSDTVPQAHAGDLGMPHHLRIEGAARPDFSDATTLLDILRENIYETGPIMMWRIPEQSCRFVRLVADESGNALESTTSRFRLGFAEIELFSRGTNVALNKPPQANTAITGPKRSLTSLTDGNNLYGRILPVRNWVEQLARRHDLETERPQIIEALSLRYARQRTSLHRMSWLAALFAAATVITVLVERVIRQRAVFKTRERIAANLHDELGANLHAIGLFGDLAKREVKQAGDDIKWDKLVRYVDEVRTLTQETGDTARYCTNLLEAHELFENLPEEMRRLSDRLLADLQSKFNITHAEVLQQLKPRRRIDLYLFYKECLTNIVRHSGATQVTTHLTADLNHIELAITDNGCGFNNAIPLSLKRRARLLGARVTHQTPPAGGTCITLKRKIRRWSRNKKS